MRLIGMLDSPYVRRVAISMAAMELRFVHQPLSVFSDYDDFAAINPVVKAPTLVTDAGIVLMESSLILEYLDRLAAPERRLAPAGADACVRAQRILGLALVACEKTVQIVYERNLRPVGRQHQPWIDRVQGQLAAAYRLLEAEVGDARSWLFGERVTQADITSAVAWRFTQLVLPGVVAAETHPSLVALSARAERTEAFRTYPAE